LIFVTDLIETEFRQGSGNSKFRVFIVTEGPGQACTRWDLKVSIGTR